MTVVDLCALTTFHYIKGIIFYVICVCLFMSLICISLARSFRAVQPHGIQLCLSLPAVQPPSDISSPCVIVMGASHWHTNTKLFLIKCIFDQRRIVWVLEEISQCIPDIFACLCLTLAIWFVFWCLAYLQIWV